tara:strand:- start:480 stop:716 length:237 start_codon:yes stop_codon:yes gene_type:complete
MILLIFNKGQIMDTTKWKSIAVRIEDYKLLRGLCKSKFRAPAGMISKLVHEYIEYQAKKNKVKVENYKKELMNGDANE